MSQYKSLTSINQNRLFAGINPESLKINLKQGNFLEFQEGDIIYQNGDKDDSIYLVIDGEIKVKIRQPLSGTSVLRKGRNEFFGENEFLDKNARHSSAVANTNSILFKLNRKEVVAIASEFKTVLKNLNGDESILEEEEQTDNTAEDSIPDTPEMLNEEDQATEESVNMDFSGLDQPEQFNSPIEQINWDEQKFDNLDDLQEGSVSEQNEALNISADDLLKDENIRWDTLEPDNLEDMPARLINDQSEETSLPENGLNSDENIKWERDEFDNISDLSDEHLNELNEESGVSENASAGDDDVKWSDNEFNGIADLPDEHLNELNEESGISENNSAGDDDVKWNDNEFNGIADLPEEQLSTLSEETDISETVSENSDDVKWDNNEFNNVADLPGEHLGELSEGTDVPETRAENADEVKWGDEEFNNVPDLPEEQNNELNEETELPESTDCVKWDDKDFKNIADLPDEQQSGPDEKTGTLENSLDTEENEKQDDKQLDHIEDLTDYRTDDLNIENISPDNETENEDQEKWDEKQFSNLEDLPIENLSGTGEETGSGIDDMHDSIGTGIDEENAAGFENETSIGKDNLYFAQHPDAADESLESKDETGEFNIDKELSGDYNNLIEEQNVNSDDSYYGETGIADETIPADDEEKPVIGIYESSDSDSAKELTDLEIYERVLRDLIYLYRSKNRPDTLITINELVKNFTGATLVNFYLVDSLNNEMDLLGVEDNNITHGKFTPGEGLTAASVINNEIINLKNPYEDSRYNSETDSFGGIGINNILCFPVNNSLNEVTALFCLANGIYDSFSEKDEKYLRIFSEHALNHLSNIEELEKIPANLQTKSTEKMSNFVIEDIKTPLLIIKHYADFIKRKAVPEEIRVVTGYMLNQVESILSFSSVISDLVNSNISITPEKYKLDELLDELLEMLAEYVDTRKVKLFKRYDSTAEVNADKSKLYHALYQLTKILCSNMPDGGSIYLVTSLKKNNIEISFKDTGKGLPDGSEDILSKQFTELENIDELSMELSIAKKITDDHGGTLKLKKNGENGTEFLIVLPVSE